MRPSTPPWRKLPVNSSTALSRVAMWLAPLGAGRYLRFGKCLGENDMRHWSSESSPSTGSITQILNDAKHGDQQAATELWERYFHRLVAIARRKFHGATTKVADEEDAVASAFASLFRGIEENRFPSLNNRDDLWQELVRLTAGKATSQRKREQAQKRGGGNVRGESVFAGEDSEVAAGIAEFLTNEETPAFTIEMEEECQRLFDMLDDDLRRIALWRLEGYSNQEIADMTGHILSWVERKFRIIRRRWASATA